MSLPLLITNNRCCAEAFTEYGICLFDESWDYGQVLKEVRDKAHQGYLMLSHPQCGSMKPNQTPYKSVVLALKTMDGQDTFAGVSLAEQALLTYEKFQEMHPTPAWPENVLEDFRTIDLSLMQSVFNRLLKHCQ